MSSPLIQAQDLSYAFGPRILFSGLTLSVGAGEIWAVIGDSGAGKSTLLKILTGELQSPTGSVQKNAKVSEVPQGLALCPGLTARETIATGDLQGMSWLHTLTGLKKSSLEKAKSVAQSLCIAHALDQDVEEISGGERQRVALGRALLQNSQILIADEPFSALDHDLGEELFRFLQHRMAEKQGALICSLHQRHLVTQFATHILEISPRFASGWQVRKTSGAAL